ncbi:MAG: DUF4032 domain-containing protein [Endomicrobium sp.]|jgi:hypothetical protein|nr:DUF4032 domain-containing protein [Endomicrobium sp.]
MSEERDILVDFGSIEKNLQKYKIKNKGIQAIGTEKIVGSLNRYNDFSENMLPYRGDSNMRFANIERAMLSGVNLPPIQVYQVLDSYFIIDGHHRAAVARKVFNAEFIDAEVFEVKFEFDISIIKNYSYDTESAKDFLIKLEENSFSSKTYLSNAVLKHPLKVTELKSYVKLLDEIEHYKAGYNKGEFAKKHMIFASYHWYEHSFLPSVSIMEEDDVLSGFPERTYTDLYVWMQQHKYYLSQQAGRDVGFDFTAHDFVRKYKKVKPLYLIPSKIKDILHGIKERIEDFKE